MPTNPRRRAHTRRRAVALGAVALALALGAGLYLVIQRGPQLLSQGPGCVARSGRAALSLDPQQASIAATIAGVAHRRDMPPYAVEVAYATAMQESKLHNLDYGTLDSVGVFQQRPSQGWGPARSLLNPVYATTRFFEALATVPGYEHLPVYQAAQDVQRSADGYAYMQWEKMAAHMASAFTGRAAHSVWCWSSGSVTGRARLTGARRGLAEAFGPVAARHAASPGDAPTLLVRAGSPPLGWAVAAWLVTHAGQYRLHEVRYERWQWRASAGQAGWTPVGRSAPRGQVEAN